MNNNYYLGVVTAVENHELLTKPKEYREVVVDIPGVMENILAYPKSCELDEPKVGDPVILECLDPIYKSYFTYYKLKENNFLGIRAAGKCISITPETITIGIFDKDTEYKDSEVPEMKTKITIDSDGNIDIQSTGTVSVNSGDSINIKSEGDININGGGNNVTISNATLKTKGGTATATGEGGFCGIPICPFTGAPHVTTDITNIL